MLVGDDYEEIGEEKAEMIRKQLVAIGAGVSDLRRHLLGDDKEDARFNKYLHHWPAERLDGIRAAFANLTNKFGAAAKAKSLAKSAKEASAAT